MTFSEQARLGLSSERSLRFCLVDSFLISQQVLLIMVVFFWFHADVNKCKSYPELGVVISRYLNVGVLKLPIGFSFQHLQEGEHNDPAGFS